MRFVYLHGFASSPASRKAVAFQKALAAHGISLELPALDGGDFQHLTTASQLEIVTRLLAGQPACLIGSSMGGYIAALYASMHPEIARVVLMAPAFAFAERWDHLAGPEKLASWRRSGYLEVFHYGEGRANRVHYALYEEALGLPRFPPVAQPVQIFHGIHDDVVPVELSREYAANKPNVFLSELDSGHELLNVLDSILHTAVPFLISTASDPIVSTHTDL